MKRLLGQKLLCIALIFQILAGASMPAFALETGVPDEDMGEGMSVGESQTARNGIVIPIEYPGDGEDASPNIQKAIALAKSLDRPVTLAFEAGKTYEVWPETAYHNMNYYISNAATKSENANGERWSAIFLKDMQNVTIEGNDAMLMVHGVMTPILVDNSENVTFQNLHVDWARPTMSEFTITEVGDNFARIQVNESSLYEIEGNQVRWLSEKKPDGSYYWTVKGGLCAQYNPANDTAWRSGFSWGNAIQDEGNGVLKLTYGSRPGLTVGQTYQFRSGSRDQVGSFIHKSKNVHFENMGFHYMHGLGIVGQRTENLSFNKLDCTPRPETGRTCASSADFIQISGCKGLVSVTNSKFKGAHDDVFNIHGTHLRIVKKDEAQNMITVQFKEERSWGFEVFDVGDEIEFINANSMIPYGKNEVERVNRLNDHNIELFLKDSLPANIALNFDAVENITYTPDVIVKDNYASAIPTRGILCTTRGDVLIEGNTFYRMQMSGVLLEDDARGWYESGLIQNMTIKDNIFDNCGGPVIHSNPQTNVPGPENTVHSNITITGNTFRGNSQISAHHTANLVVEGNTFENGGSVSLNSCNGFEIKDNNIGLGSVSASNSLNDRSLTSIELDTTTQIETLDRAGMTATASNERAGYAAGNVLDGNNGSIWHSDWENVPEELSITVDLNGAKTFNRVAYLPRQNGESGGMIKAYELYTKNGEGEFSKAAAGEWAVNASEKYITLAQPITATQIKLVATDVVVDSSNRRIASAAEINFQNVQEKADSVSAGTKFKVGFTATGMTGMPSQLPEGAISYQSSDETVATVAADGTITALTEGTADITIAVTAYGKTLSSTATVAVTGDTYTAADSIAIEEIPAAVGSTLQLTATVEPAGAESDLCWSVETISGGKASIDQTGLLTASASARVLVTAYSQNDPSVKDTLMLVVKPGGEAAGTWSIVRENKANWKLGAGSSLELTTEPGAIWSGTTNTVKNVITTAAGKDDFSLVTKMDYTPGANYAEAGIILYVDDDNYTLLSRKKHTDYGGNIFSMITEVGGAPKESPAAIRVPDAINSREVYLKLTKTGDVYSGYFSADGITWSPVWENQTLALGATPRVGVIGYGSGVAKYAYLEVDGEKVTFEDLVPPMSFAEAEVTAVTPAQYKTVKGTAWEALSLPERVSLTWNGDYRDTEPVVWAQDGYDKDTLGSYEVAGTLKTVTSAMLGEHSVTAVITVTADKSALREAVRIARTKVEAGYTTESWAVFAAALEAASDMLASTDDTLTQEAVDTRVAALKAAQGGLIRKSDRETLTTLTTVAGTALADTAETLYLDEQAQGDRYNGYYSTAAHTALSASKTAAEELLATEDPLADEEVALVTKALVDALEALSASKNIVDCVALQEKADQTKADLAALQESDYTAESWAAVNAAITAAEALIATEIYTANEVTAATQAITAAWNGLRRNSDGYNPPSETITYLITATAGTGGKISPASTRVPSGGSRTFQMTADKDYVLTDLLLDGVSVSFETVANGWSYTLTNVRAAHSLKAVFTLESEIKDPETPLGGYVFTDVTGHWAASAIDFAAKAGLMTGVSATSFNPEGTATRATVATILYRMAGSPAVEQGTSFTDVDAGAWYAAAVTWCAGNGVIDGVSATSFAPDREITRQELATMLCRYAKHTGAATTATGESLSTFPDNADIAAWAREAMAWCTETGILTGKSGGLLAPRGTATRAELATMLERFVTQTAAK